MRSVAMGHKGTSTAQLTFAAGGSVPSANGWTIERIGSVYFLEVRQHATPTDL
jgi:hypothetical protein